MTATRTRTRTGARSGAAARSGSRSGARTSKRAEWIEDDDASVRRVALSRSEARARRSSVRRTRKEVQRAQTPMAFWVILSVVGVLCLLGLIMVLSVTTVKATYENGGAGYFFTRQAVYLAIGGVLMYLAYKFGHRRVRYFAKPAMATSVVLLVAVLFLGDKVNGSRRWFDISIFNVQPSEIAKLAVILWVARLLASRRNEMNDWKRTILPVGVGLGATGLLIYLEPDLGTAVVLTFVVAVMLVVGGARMDVLGYLALPGVAVIGLAAVSGYHAERWGFLNPTTGTYTTNYQLGGSLSSIANGGWFGVGPGASMAKWGFLPEAHTDAIFAPIAEEMGVVGALSVIGMYVVLLGAGLRVAREAVDEFARLLAIGISTLIAVQAFVNIGVSLGMLPNKGFTLPFVSYGGSSLLVMLTAAGLLLSIAREGSTAKARQRRREAMERRNRRRRPAPGNLVLVSSDGWAARRSAATARAGAARAGAARAVRSSTARRTPTTRTTTSRSAATRSTATRSTATKRPATTARATAAKRPTTTARATAAKRPTTKRPASGTRSRPALRRP